MARICRQQFGIPGVNKSPQTSGLSSLMSRDCSVWRRPPHPASNRHHRLELQRKNHVGEGPPHCCGSDSTISTGWAARDIWSTAAAITHFST